MRLNRSGILGGRIVDHSYDAFLSFPIRVASPIRSSDDSQPRASCRASPIILIHGPILCTFVRLAEGNINDVLIKTLAEAHATTNLKLEIVHEMFRKPQVREPPNLRSATPMFPSTNTTWFRPRARALPSTAPQQDISRVLHYKNMSQETLWLDCAEKLTAMIQNIIEFAKLIPGFMRLSQDDQVSLRHLPTV